MEVSVVTHSGTKSPNPVSFPYFKNIPPVGRQVKIVQPDPRSVKPEPTSRGKDIIGVVVDGEPGVIAQPSQGRRIDPGPFLKPYYVGFRFGGRRDQRLVHSPHGRGAIQPLANGIYDA